MTGDQESAAECQLSAANVVDALREWGIVDATVEPIRGGVNGQVFLVSTQAHRFVAKLAYDDRDHFEIGLRTAELAPNTDSGDTPKTIVCRRPDRDAGGTAWDGSPARAPGARPRRTADL